MLRSLITNHKEQGTLGLYLGLIVGLTSNCAPEAPVFREQWPQTQRTWIGPAYWANPMQDWQVNQGQVECISSGGDRNVFLLTHELADTAGSFEMSVNLGRLESGTGNLDSGWVGFKIGIRGDFNDYRDNAVRGRGLRAGITTRGRLFIGNLDRPGPVLETRLDKINLELNVRPKNQDYEITLIASDQKDASLGQIQRSVSSDWLHRGLALVCSHGRIDPMPLERGELDYPNWGTVPGTERAGNVRFWFDDWTISGTKVRVLPERKFGPVLFAQHTLSRGTVKLTAQIAPMGSDDDQSVSLEIKTGDDQRWTAVGSSAIDQLSRTATFRVDGWDASSDTPYRVVYNFLARGNQISPYHYEGTIRQEPLESEMVVVAGFTGNNDLGFPNNDLVDNVKIQDPDFLFFSGDQIYEGVGGYGTQRSPLEKASLDYLRKWYLFGWTYADLMKDRPAICLPDDHDVYHGNIWGANGRATPEGMEGSPAHDEGGYKMPPEWVNMVQRTQTSHFPEPFDPNPVLQGIGVYYTEMVYGGISFAIIEDRKFKSAPKHLLPQAQIDNGWPQNRDFNSSTQSDVSGAELLGERQLQFLGEWAADWSQGTWMKVVLSQTIFANLATIPAAEFHDRVVPQLRIMKEGEYAEGDKIVADFDSNGWPQTGRNKALRENKEGVCRPYRR